MQITRGDLRFIRSTDASGTSWGSPETVDSSGDTGLYSSLAVIAGYPAIAYMDGTSADPKYIRATNANGSVWGSPVALDSTDGGYTSLGEVDGVPAVAYHGAKFIRSNDTTGSNWGTSETVDPNGGGYESLEVINGHPAIVYQGEGGSLAFAIYY